MGDESPVRTRSGDYRGISSRRATECSPKMAERGAEVYGWSGFTGSIGAGAVGCGVQQSEGADPNIDNPNNGGGKERSDTVVTQGEHERARGETYDVQPDALYV